MAERRPPEEILQAVLSAVRSVLDVDVVAIALLDPTGATVTVRASSTPELLRRVFPQSSLAWCVAAFGRAEAVPDLATDPRRGPISAELPFRRTLCAPMRAKDVARGVLLAGCGAPGAQPTDSMDLSLLVAFGEFAAHALVAEAERLREIAFHQKLEWLAAASHLRLKHRRDLDAELRGIAERQSVDIYEEHRSEPLLRDVVVATHAVAAAIAVREEDGRFGIADALGLKCEEILAWQEDGDACQRFHDERRMSLVTAGADSGFPRHRQDMRVQIPCDGATRVLHVLSAKGRQAFGPEDLRCAEIVAVQIAALADRKLLEAKLNVALAAPEVPLVLEPLQ